MELKKTKPTLVLAYDEYLVIRKFIDILYENTDLDGDQMLDVIRSIYIDELDRSKIDIVIASDEKNPMADVLNLKPKKEEEK